MTRKQTLVTYENIRMQKHLNYTCDKEYDSSQFLCIEYHFLNYTYVSPLTRIFVST